MPRQIAKRLMQTLQAQRHKWYFRLFGERLTDPHIWHINRRSVTAAFGAGLAIAFIPLPVHTVVGVGVAIWKRWNLAVILASAFIVNPLTMVPIYLMAYRVGALLLGRSGGHFQFEMSWAWLERGLGPAWASFLLGCAVCGIGLGLLGRFVLEIVWRKAVMKKYQARCAARASGLNG
ncbi:MAG: DUF2062 domain-containing protein [Steroidobacteraceae bacterium]